MMPSVAHHYGIGLMKSLLLKSYDRKLSRTFHFKLLLATSHYQLVTLPSEIKREDPLDRIAAIGFAFGGLERPESFLRVLTIIATNTGDTRCNCDEIT